MPPNSHEYQKNYMKQYIARSDKINCPICNHQYKLVYRYKHVKTKYHLLIENFLKSFTMSDVKNDDNKGGQI